MEVDVASLRATSIKQRRRPVKSLVSSWCIGVVVLDVCLSSLVYIDVRAWLLWRETEWR